MKRFGSSLGHDNPSRLTGLIHYRTVPLALISAGPDGKPTINNSLILDTREKTFPLDTTKPYKLNAKTTGVCMSSILYQPSWSLLPWADRTLYSPDIVAKISAEVAKPDSIFSSDDRVGLVLDSIALAQAGLSDTSSAFTLINGLRQEGGCMLLLP